jgi:serine protease Do
MRATLTHQLGPKKGKREQFEVDRISIGRAPNNTLSLGDEARRVSSHHAEIVRRGDHFVLRDLGSTNGTMINGRRVIASEVHKDDLIEFGAGGPLLRFGVESDEAAAEGEAMQRQQTSPGSRAGAVGPKTSETLARRAARQRKTNLRLIVAIVLAMISGAAGGIMLSSGPPAPSVRVMTFTEVAELNVPAVVLIRAEFELLDVGGQVVETEARIGSGFVISPDGLIVTNRHVVRAWEYIRVHAGLTGRTTKIDVMLPGQRQEVSIPAEVYRLSDDSLTDVAILKVNSSRMRFVHGVELNLSETSQGDEVSVIGYPLGLSLLETTKDEQIEPSLFTGIVSRVGHDYIQLNLRAYHGNSGGPVLNRKGQVIGILTGNLPSAQDITLSTPISAAYNLVMDKAAEK